jgi:hypothetical protein
MQTRLARAVRTAHGATGAAVPQHREEHRQANWLRDVILGGSGWPGQHPGVGVYSSITLTGDWRKNGLKMVAIGLGAAAVGFLIARLFHTAGA